MIVVDRSYAKLLAEGYTPILEEAIFAGGSSSVAILRMTEAGVPIFMNAQTQTRWVPAWAQQFVRGPP